MYTLRTELIEYTLRQRKLSKNIVRNAHMKAYTDKTI